MARNRNFSRMLSALGATQRLLKKLDEELQRRGGCENMLHALVRGKKPTNIGAVADLIVSMPYRDPVSKTEIMKLAGEISVAECGGTYHVDVDELFFWEPALMQLGIPYINFAHPDNGNGKDWGIWPPAPELCKQLEGKPLDAGMEVTWNGRRYVVTTIIYFHESEEKLGVGKPFEMNCVEFLHLSLAHHFDLTK